VEWIYYFQPKILPKKISQGNWLPVMESDAPPTVFKVERTGSVAELSRFTFSHPSKFAPNKWMHHLETLTLS
jgi:hypothetical protein